MKTLAIITSHASSLIYFRAELIKTLVAKGVRVLAFAPNFDDKSRAEVLAFGAKPIDCPMSRTGMNPFLDAWNTWHLFILLRRFKPDVTLGYFVKPVIFGSIAAWLAGVPRRFAMVEGLGFVFTESATGLSFQRRLLKYLVMGLYKIGMSRVERVIFLNPDDQIELVNAGLLPAEKGYLLGGIGVDLSRWPMTPPMKAPVTFLLVARLLREKGIEQFAAAACIVKKKYPEVRFILLGGLDQNPGGITIDNVQVWVKEGVLEWYGHVPVQPWLKQTSVYVLPSFREGVPVSTQEAMAMGRPIITTDVPGCRETVVDGVNGFLVPVRDHLALAERMFIFINNPDIISRMGFESRRLAEERFDVKKNNEKLIKLIIE